MSESALLVPEIDQAPLNDSPEGAVRSVARNSTVMIIGQALTFTLTFILNIFLQRYLGPTNFGRLYFAMSIAWIGAIFIDAGMSVLLVKEVARAKERLSSFLTAASFVRTVSSILIYGAIVAIVWGLGKPGEDIYVVAIISASIIVESFVQLLTSFYQAYEKMIYPALGTIAEKLVITIVSVSLLLSGYSVLAIAWVLLGGALTNLLFVSLFLGRLGGKFSALDWKLCRYIIISSSPFFLWAAFGVIYQRIDAFMLSFMAGDDVTGWYGLSARLYETLSFLPYIFQTAIFPILARLALGNSTSMQNAIRRSTEMIILIAAPMAIGTFMLAREIVDILGGLNKYGPSVSSLQIFGLGLVPLYIDMVFGVAIVSTDKQKPWALVAILAAIFNPLFNILAINLTQHYYANGGIGAALTTVLTELLIMCFAVRLLPKGTLDKTLFLWLGRCLGAAILMGLLIWVWQFIDPFGARPSVGEAHNASAWVRRFLNIGSGVTLATILYLALSFALHTLDWHQLKNLRQSLGRTKRAR